MNCKPTDNFNLSELRCCAEFRHIKDFIFPYVSSFSLVSERHSGQVTLCSVNHISIQPLWKTCLQNNTRTSSVSPNSSKQTVHLFAQPRSLKAECVRVKVLRHLDDALAVPSGGLV